ncbi:hypothetical protein A0J61_05397 [Choanephora cucurbitarum]|uniref:Uncharacterized protein n=1 Tax=Choanephora cucurbitarum TaxID=101091 RepID=A0A1C7NC48_9FUNG|nr:hypothetical protein A0J61_05397 [Choanephora cucurbitarum]
MNVFDTIYKVLLFGFNEPDSETALKVLNSKVKEHLDRRKDVGRDSVNEREGVEKQQTLLLESESEIERDRLMLTRSWEPHHVLCTGVVI